MSVFVTVGTTLFDALVETVLSEEVKQALQNLGYLKLIVQYGKGKFVPENQTDGNLPTEVFDYKPSIAECINNSSLVISHAGAGSCLEVLSAGKPLIVVVNEKLMNNHQYELAKRLYKDGHLLYCTTSNLMETLESIQKVNLLPFPKPETKKFSAFMDAYFGFTEQS